jgi:DNA-binding MarR family transcriptional regulator
LIKKLINKKFVEKIRDQEDRRYVHVDITPIGKKFIDEHKLLISQRLKDKLSILNQKDLQKLSKSLDELKEIISKLD